MFNVTTEPTHSALLSLSCSLYTTNYSGTNHHNKLKLSGQILSNPPEKSHRCEAVCMLLSDILS